MNGNEKARETPRAEAYVTSQEENRSVETGTQRPPLTEEDLKEIETRAERADKGPWWVEGIGGVHMDGTRDAYVVRAPGAHIPGALMPDFLIRFRRKENADFVAHAREDVPKLIETVRYWRKRAERAETIVQRVREFARALGEGRA